MTDALSSNLQQQQTAGEQWLSTQQDTFTQIHQTFNERLEHGLAEITQSSDQLGESAVDMASLAEAFNGAVERFDSTNQTLLNGLQTIEKTLQKAGVRNDEQLNYYVTQARELIDHSALSQKQLLDQVQQLSQPKATADADS